MSNVEWFGTVYSFAAPVNSEFVNQVRKIGCGISLGTKYTQSFCLSYTLTKLDIIECLYVSTL